MHRNGLAPTAIVRAAEDLSTLAKRVSEREKKNRTGQLEHVKKQAADVLAARQKVKHGEWDSWCKEAGLGRTRAWQYAEFGKCSVTEHFADLPEDEQWTRWQRISGNSPPLDKEDQQFASETVAEIPDAEPERKEVRRQEPDEPGDGEVEDEEAEESDDPNNNRTAYFLWADEAIRLAEECRKMAAKINATKDVLKIARRAAASWSGLVSYLES